MLYIEFGFTIYLIWKSWMIQYMAAVKNDVHYEITCITMNEKG
ncbi:hypothetical protein B4082_1104 [Bacillus cereus]|uniref:Uncharacterized protein n=1 Tax=Bacillus cereus TaxID=1396 RepID=A0A164H971_BACCE|nr:hypothetical protein B4082_1104 [Bacillus cereus]